MDRTLKVYAGTGHLFLELTFNYDHTRQATANYIQYRPLNIDDEDDERKSVFVIDERDLHLQYRDFATIEEIKAHDKEFVKKEFGRDMKDAANYTYVYDEQPVLLRYVAANHIGCIGIINILFSFIGNTKDVKFLSATNPRFDFDITSNSLETNLSCILRIPVYMEREDPREINAYDLTRLPAWY